MGSERVLDVAVRRHVFAERLDGEVLGLLRQVTGLRHRVPELQA